jgi:hypothetical protein
MAHVVRQAAAGPTSAQIFVALSHAGHLLDTLGQRPCDGSTLAQIIEAQPQLLKTWGTSRRQTPMAIDQRVFAKAVQSLLDVLDHVGHTAGAPTAPTSAAVPSAPPAGMPLAPQVPPPVPARISGPEGARARGIVATRVLTANPALDWRTRWLAVLWSWSPVACILLAMFVMMGVAQNPDLVLVVPCRIAGLGFLYANFVFERFWQRLETEMTRWLYGQAPAIRAGVGSASSTDLASSPGPVAMYVPQQNPPVLAWLGWAAALYAYSRQP